MTAIFMVVAVVVVAWFAAGTLVNVRRGSAILRWMQGGLPLLGERTTVRWLGTTAVELVIRDARAPFRQVTLVVFLEPRDMPWMWAWTRRRGRRDTLIVRGVLGVAPRTDVEILDRESWSGREALGRAGGGAWSVREPSTPGALPVYSAAPGGFALADALLARARDARLGVRRLSVRRAEPHLQLHVAPPSAAASASEFFETVRALAERAQGADVRPAIRP